MATIRNTPRCESKAPNRHSVASPHRSFDRWYHSPTGVHGHKRRSLDRFRHPSCLVSDSTSDCRKGSENAPSNCGAAFSIPRHSVPTSRHLIFSNTKIGLWNTCRFFKSVRGRNEIPTAFTSQFGSGGRSTPDGQPTLHDVGSLFDRFASVRISPEPSESLRRNRG